MSTRTVVLPHEEEKALQRIYCLFPQLNEEQKRQLEALWDLYLFWNERINLISRKDIIHLYSHHILHSVGITQMLHFKPLTTVLDVGTGGGFPGIPLAILFPHCHFLLLDGTAKKIKVCQEVIQSLGLTNVEAYPIRVEDFSTQVHFVVSRAAMPLIDLCRLTQHLFRKESFNALPNGIIVLKGGDLTKEIEPFRCKVQIESLTKYLGDAYYEEKKVVYLPVTLP